MDLQSKQNSFYIKAICLFFSVSFLITSPIAALYLNSWGETFPAFFTIITSPCPLVTDYFQLGNLAAAFLNAGLCGLSYTLLMLKTECRSSMMAGFFLVVAHCFYGLNFLNMWPPILGIFIFCKISRIDFGSNLDMAMLSTAFGPFVSEMLFRYPLGNHFRVGTVDITAIGIIYVIIFSLFLGFAIPATLPGALKMHRGYNLYNGGLAFGLLGLFIYSFMYKTMGISAPRSYSIRNAVYDSHLQNYWGFTTIYFLIVFGICLLTGWLLNGKTLKGYRTLLNDTGHRTDFFTEYGPAQVLINIGIYGFFVLTYFSLVIHLTVGAGVTGATMGVTLAALTFSAQGQHPKNVWPILVGFFTLSVLVTVIRTAAGLDVPWTLSTQGYINAAAFATGLCPISGRFGKRFGVLAGFMCAVMCTSTSAIHGGFVLYNGGLTAGITALILVPCLDYYWYTRKMNEMKPTISKYFHHKKKS
ncbi:MAG: DUF1576 domain-containing protein [Lachnospiraceae bacterium]